MSPPRALRILLAADFTAVPMVPTIGFWLETAGIEATVSPVAPDRPLLSQLLQPDGELAGNEGGINVIAMRATTAGQSSRLSDELVDALQCCARESTAHWVVAYCPARPVTPDAHVDTAIGGPQEMDARQRLALLPNVTVVAMADVVALLQDRPYYDAVTDAIGDAPYTDHGHAAIATVVARSVHALVTPPRKVIVLDCDDTLWDGVCGEAPFEVTITPARRWIQQFFVDQVAAGALLCLCSKNREEDVWRVFEDHPEMPLRREHFVGSRINWSAKPDNIQDLAAELCLSLDTFVVVDDSPLEVAAINAALPEVATVLLRGAAGGPAILRGAWVFDRRAPTPDDQHRTDRYRLHRQREGGRRDGMGADEYARILGLTVDVGPAADDDCRRVAQLTYRTTQFNCTLRRRSETEVAAVRRRADYLVLTARASDDYGDYGIVGAVIARYSATELEVDTFVLSCRALGRGVEHRMAAALDDCARRRGCSQVSVRYVAGERNVPARQFLESREHGWVKHLDTSAYVRPVHGAMAGRRGDEPRS